MRRAEAKLAELPDDPAANLALGAFQLSYDLAEEAGLEALRKCGVEALVAAAALDLEGPQSREGFKAAADAWEKAKSVWSVLHPRVAAVPAAREAVTETARNPDSKTDLRILRLD